MSESASDDTENGLPREVTSHDPTPVHVVEEGEEEEAAAAEEEEVAVKAEEEEEEVGKTPRCRVIFRTTG